MTPHTPSPPPAPPIPGPAASAVSQGVGVPVTGEQDELSAGDYRAVATELGAGLRELSLSDTPSSSVTSRTSYPRAPPASSSRHGPTASITGAITSVAVTTSWTSAKRGTATRSTGSPGSPHGCRYGTSGTASCSRHPPHGYAGYPFCLEIDTEYRLTPNAGLSVTISATNRGTRPAPYGFGQHPYLTVGASALDEWELTLPATRWLPVDQRGIPSGPAEDIDGAVCDFRGPRAIGGARLDHALTGLTRESDGRAWAHLRSAGAQVSLWPARTARGSRCSPATPCPVTATARRSASSR